MLDYRDPGEEEMFARMGVNPSEIFQLAQQASTIYSSS
jgi:hypothetical protein